MSANDFFKKVDDKIETINDDNELKGKKSKELSDFIEQTLNDLKPILESYVEKLKKRNIRCESNINSGSFSLTMYYKDGGHHSIIFGRNIRSNNDSYIYQSDFTSDDGKNYMSTDAASITKSNFSIKDAEKRIQKEIEDFLFYAPRHGGY